MRNLLISISLLCLAAPTVGVAQDRPRDGSDDRPPSERGRRAERPGPGQFGDRFFAMVSDRLADELELDEQQQAQFDQLVAEFREKAQQQRLNSADMEDLVQQMREARDAGDEQRIMELRDQMRALRGGGDPLRVQFLDEVEKILREDQLPRLVEFRDRMAERERMGPGGFGGPMQGRMLERLKSELNLSEEQESQFDDLAAKLREEMRPGRDGGGFERMRESMEHFQAELRKILTPEQTQVLDEFSARMPGAGRGAALDPRGVIRAARRIADLTEDQRDKLAAIEEDAQRAERDIGRDRAARAELAGSVRAQIVAMLTPEQKEAFERSLIGARPQRGDRDRQRDRDRDRTPPGGPPRDRP